MRRPTALAVLAGMLLALVLLGGCGHKPAATKPTATLAPAMRDWAAVACGSYHTLALKKDGSLWAWGLNDYGELGRGTIDATAHPTPIEVGHAHDWAAVSCGYGDTLALKKGGSLWAWGHNEDGELGLGDANHRFTPIEVGHGHDWAAVFCGYYHTLALKKDGTLWAWGYNDFGELGLGDTASRLAPTQVGSASAWATVCCAAHHSLALKKDGTLWAWGENSYGQLGLGDTRDRHTPTEVGHATDWAAIVVGGSDYYHTLALKKDGTLWAWGFNQFGQLGLGDTSDRHTPTELGLGS